MLLSYTKINSTNSNKTMVAKSSFCKTSRRLNQIWERRAYLPSLYQWETSSSPRLLYRLKSFVTAQWPWTITSSGWEANCQPRQVPKASIVESVGPKIRHSSATKAAIYRTITKISSKSFSLITSHPTCSMGSSNTRCDKLVSNLRQLLDLKLSHSRDKDRNVVDQLSWQKTSMLIDKKPNSSISNSSSKSNRIDS